MTSTSNINTGLINSGNINAPTITASINLFYESTYVGTKIGQLETSLNTKQATLTSTTNITTGTISSGNITVPTITESTN